MSRSFSGSALMPLNFYFELPIEAATDETIGKYDVKNRVPVKKTYEGLQDPRSLS